MFNPSGQTKEDVIEERKEWKENQENMDVSNTYFLDEMGINCGMTPLYGRAKKNERIYEHVPDVRFERTSVIGALGKDGVIAPLTYKGTLNGELFKVYVETQLAPAMKAGDTLVLDNLAVHKMKDILQPLLTKGINVRFLPRYSPDYNPMELAWSKIKSILKKLKARTYETLFNGVAFALSELSKDDISGWVRHCGYSL